MLVRKKIRKETQNFYKEIKTIMSKIYHLSSCSTCQKIIKEINPDSSVELQDIKQENIDGETLDWIKEKVGSYEALFSKRAMNIGRWG